MSEVRTRRTFQNWIEEEDGGPVETPEQKDMAQWGTKQKAWNAALASAVQTGRFEVGQSVEVLLDDGTWVAGTISAYRNQAPLATWTDNATHVRPLPQTVELTVEDKAIALINNKGMTWLGLALTLANGKTIDELCAEYNIPTTREVPHG